MNGAGNLENFAEGDGCPLCVTQAPPGWRKSMALGPGGLSSGCSTASGATDEARVLGPVREAVCLTSLRVQWAKQG